MKRNRRRKLTLIEIVAIVFIVGVMLIIAIPNFINNRNMNKEKNNRRIDYCNALCKSDDFYIKNDKCYCSSGEIIDIQE